MKPDRKIRRDKLVADWRPSVDIKRSAFCATVALAFLLSAAFKSEAQVTPPDDAQAPPPTPHGVWFDDTGQGAIEIDACGDRLCGRIVWLQDETGDDGQPLVDALNPDAERREHPICGLQVIGDLVLQPNGAWDRGWIYDPKEGRSYDVEIRLRAPDRLQVKGYLGLKFLSETFIWQRAPDELPRCSA